MDTAANPSPAGQKTIWLIGFSHGTTHWIMATFFTVLPFLAQDLGLSYAQAGILVSAFHFSSFAANFISGAAVDLTGKRIWFQIASLGLGAIAMVAFSLSSEFWFLCIMMCVVGACNNLWHPSAISFLSHNFPKRRGYALSIHTLFASAADAIAPLVAGIALSILAWQGTSALSVVPSVIAASMLLMLLSHDRQPDALARVGMTFAAYRQGLGQVFRNSAVLGLALMAGFRNMAQAGLLMFLPLYLADDLNVTPITVGVALMAMQAGGMIAGPIAGAVSDQIGRRPVVASGLTLTTIVIVLITFAGDAVTFVAGVSILGFALFAVRPVIQSWMMDLVPPQLAASGTSVLFGAQSVMSALAPIIGGLIADEFGLLPVFYFLAAAILIANLAVLLLPRE